MKYDQEKIEKALVVALKDLDMQQIKISEVAFHMTDWLDDLEEWTRFCEKPESVSSEKIQDLLIGFLVHVPHHIAAASKLVTGIPVTDIFDVGATKEGDD